MLRRSRGSRDQPAEAQSRRPWSWESRFVRLVRLEMATEALAHGGDDLFRKRVLLARAEARVERRGEDIGGDGFFEGSHDGPAAFAGVLDITGVGRKLRVLRGRGS